MYLGFTRIINVPLPSQATPRLTKLEGAKRVLHRTVNILKTKLARSTRRKMRTELWRARPGENTVCLPAHFLDSGLLDGFEFRVPGQSVLTPLFLNGRKIREQLLMVQSFKLNEFHCFLVWIEKLRKIEIETISAKECPREAKKCAPLTKTMRRLECF